MNLSPPYVLLAGPLAIAALLALFRRWPRAASLAGTGCLWLLAALLAASPADQPTATAAPLLFGHPLLLSEALRALFLLLYLGLSLLFLLATFWPQGGWFVPAALATLSPLAAALMIQPFTLAALCLIVAAVFLAVVIQADRTGSAHASLRYLIIMVLVMPLLLVGGWMVERQPLTPLLPAARLLLVGFIILLAGFPFHLWVMPIVTSTRPLHLPFIFGLAQLAIVTFIFQARLVYPWLPANDPIYTWVRWSALLTALLGGLLAVTATHFSHLLGSLLLLDMGLALLPLATGGRPGWETALSLHVVRFISLTVAGVGITLLPPLAEAGSFADSRGLARRAPFHLALFIYGCCSLLGLPLTIGFSGRWALLATALPAGSPTTTWMALLLLIALASGLAGILRALAWLLTPADQPAPLPPASGRLRRFVAVALLANLGFALFPQALLTSATRLAGLLSG